MSTLTTATAAAFFSSTAFIVTASLVAAALIAYLIYALVGNSKTESKPTTICACGYNASDALRYNWLICLGVLNASVMIPTIKG